MMASQNLPGRVFEQLRTGVTNAFDQPALDRLLRDRLDLRLEELTGGGGLAQVVDDVLGWLERTGRLEEFLDAALAEDSPTRNNVLLRVGARAFEEAVRGAGRAASGGPVRPQPPPGGRGPGPQSADPEAVVAWAQALDEARRAVCLVELAGEVELKAGETALMATGFLVAPRLVITAGHVARTGTIRGMRFELTEQAVAALPGAAEGQAPPLAGEQHLPGDPLLAHLSEAHGLAMLLLGPMTPPGAPPGSRPEPGAPSQRHHRLEVRKEAPAAGEPLFLLSHAWGRPLQLHPAWARGPLEEAPPQVLPPGAPLFSYDTDGVSRPGASGAPICDAEWRVVGVHLARGLDGAAWGVMLHPFLQLDPVRLALALSDEGDRRREDEQMMAAAV